MSFRTSRAVESSSSSSPYSPQSCRQFSISEIEAATQNFDESLVIGRGGFGKVYRGTIACGEICLDAAIKRLESTSNQGAVEFWAEVEMLSKLRHCHLVSLIGYCNERREMILVYDYMSNGTLADRLHKRRASLTWVRRLKICIGAARGLDYLHTGTGIKHGVIHRDVKSTNILLDDNWAAKISDFGLSKIGPTNQPSTYVNTFVRGTFGYMDPDYFQTGKLTRKSDVYAFGVVLFEVLCAKQAVDRSIDEEHWGLATWAQDSIKEGRLKQIIDSKLRGKISPKCLKDFALLADRCLHSHPKQRPTMAEVVVGLESILALQEKTDSELLIKLSGRRVPTFLFPFNRENSALKSLDLHLYTVGGEDRIVHRFDFNTIVYATEHFSEAKKISSYGYKSMYKGKLQNGQDVTITQYSDAITYEECMNEASILVKLEHENVIELLGYCIYGTNVYLLYDFALNATLAGLIFDPMCNLLDWNQRYKIILGVARVLVYLHNAPVRMIHGQVNPENILLDESFNPKLSCFSLATAINESDSIHVDWHFGTMYYGYMAPELLFTKYLSTKADVFSFGALVLETVTGQRICDFKPIAQDPGVCLDYVQRNWLEDTLSGIVDPRIDVDSVLTSKFIKIGLLCVQEIPEVRPTMEEVVGMFLGTFSPPPSNLTNSNNLKHIKNPKQQPFNLSDLNRVNRIGRGSGGTVYKVVHTPTGQLFALKVIYGNHDDAVRRQICREIEILRDVDNLNVVKCHDMFDHGGEIQVLLEYMDEGSLEGTHITNEASLADLTRQILSGIYYLHRNKIVHRDIKPSNLLINSKKQVKIADFGVSRILAQTMDPCNSSVGTIAYMSPERINTDLNHGIYDGFAGDIWSFGVSILEFYLGRFPFAVGRQGDWASLMCAICMAKPPEAPATASPEFRDFVSCCLQRDPAKRWTAARLLGHPFVAGVGGNRNPNSNNNNINKSNNNINKSSNNNNNQVHPTHQLLPPPPPRFSSSS